MRAQDKSSRRAFAAAVFAGLSITAAWCQTFNSGSTGADGDLIFPNAQPGQTIIFDPTTLNTPLPANHGSIYNFGVITIPKGVTVKLSGPNVAGPQYWLATGAVDIEGTVDLSGGAGYAATNLISQRIPSIPGPGGFPGGVGGSGGNYPAEPGQGPAGGAPPGGTGSGCGASGYPGGFSANQFLVPLIGGSGGGGGTGLTLGAGGGAGGGAILIASSAPITINGSIVAAGGSVASAGGGSGSGGAIRLMAATIQGNGTLNVSGGQSGSCYGGYSVSGLARLEAFNQLFSGSIRGNSASGSPYNTFLPTSGSEPTLTVATVNGVTVTPTPQGNFVVPDVTFSATGPVQVVINGSNIPPGTPVSLQFYSENGPDIVMANAAQLQGSSASSTAIVMVNLPAGFSRGFISASFSSQSAAQTNGQAKHK